MTWTRRPSKSSIRDQTPRKPRSWFSSDVNQQVDVAVGRFLSSGDRPEETHVSGAVLGGHAENLLPPVSQRRVECRAEPGGQIITASQTPPALCPRTS
jgi:hypothetical protein